MSVKISFETQDFAAVLHNIPYVCTVRVLGFIFLKRISPKEPDARQTKGMLNCSIREYKETPWQTDRLRGTEDDDGVEENQKVSYCILDVYRKCIDKVRMFDNTNCN